MIKVPWSELHFLMTNALQNPTLNKALKLSVAMYTFELICRLEAHTCCFTRRWLGDMTSCDDMITDFYTFLRCTCIINI